MERQGKVAILARRHVAASRTMDVRREAAPIEQQHHLTALLQRFVHRLFQSGTDRVKQAARFRLVPQIDQAHSRHRPIQDPRRQREQLVVAALGIVPAFQRRRRRAHDDGDVLELGAHHGDVAGMVARRRFLFEAAFVFFVDDDQAELARGREDGAAGANNDVDLPGRHAPPVGAALAVGEMAVQNGHLADVAAILEALDGLRRQGDFRDKHDRFLALPDRLGDGAKVDLGFARAGHAA